MKPKAKSEDLQTGEIAQPSFQQLFSIKSRNNAFFARRGDARGPVSLVIDAYARGFAAVLENKRPAGDSCDTWLAAMRSAKSPTGKRLPPTPSTLPAVHADSGTAQADNISVCGRLRNEFLRAGSSNLAHLLSEVCHHTSLDEDSLEWRAAAAAAMANASLQEALEGLADPNDQASTQFIGSLCEETFVELARDLHNYGQRRLAVNVSLASVFSNGNNPPSL